MDLKKNHQAGKMESINGFQHPSAPVRMPTVAEAMTFSPFTSIVPFNPGTAAASFHNLAPSGPQESDDTLLAIIPPPVAQPKIRSPAFALETQNTKHLLEQLSAGAANAEQASRRFRQTINDVRKLLDPASLPQIVFRQLKPASEDNISLSQKSTHPQELSLFAKMIFSKVAAPYRYLTPLSPGHPDVAHATDVQEIKVSNQRPDLQTPPSRVKVQPEISTRDAKPQHQQNVLPATTAQASARVVIADTLTPAERAEYKMVMDHQTPAEPLSPSSRNDGRASGSRRNISSDQLQKGDVAVSNLRSFLSDVFLAEDGLQTDTSTNAASSTSPFFDIEELQSTSAMVLQLPMQSHLDKLLLKVFRLNRGQDLDVDDFLHVQKLCQQAIDATEASNLRVYEEWSESDVSAWQTRVASAERSLVAARSLLRTMMAHLHIKELQSEDLLRLAVDTLKGVVKDCIVPLAEERSLSREKTRGEKGAHLANQIFSTAVSFRQSLQCLLNASTTTIRLLGDFLSKTHVDEMDLSSVETVCQALIFGENATNDKDSVFGVQRFETLRRCAMDVLAQIFARYHDQRREILNTILTSLGDLPATRQSARQYYLGDGKPIQLVSALLMRLVQTSAIYGNASMKQRSKVVAGATSENGQDEAPSDEDDDADADTDSEEEPTKLLSTIVQARSTEKGQSLNEVIKPLSDSVKSVAGHIASHLVTRALTTSKSGEDPHRRLLDIFTEDFLNVLGSPDWPAADVILRLLASHMLGLIRDAKSTVPTRTLALEMIGSIASGVLRLRILARSMAKSVEPSELPNLQRMVSLLNKVDAEDFHRSEVLVFDGPYRILTDALRSRGLDDAQLRSAHSWYLMQWATEISSLHDVPKHNANNRQANIKDVPSNLLSMLLDANWMENSYGTPDFSNDGKLAAMIVTLTSPLGKAFPTMFQTLLHQMSSEAPTVKSRSLKSVDMILDTDASVLDGDSQIMSYIRKCMSDSSPLVRDSALLLTAKCTVLRNSLDASAYEMVAAQINDSVATVKKRAIKLARDIYLRNGSLQMRLVIGIAIVSRILDPESGIADLAQQTMEEIWFQTLRDSPLEGDRDIGRQNQFKTAAVMLIHTVDSLGHDSRMLEIALKRILSQSKSSQGNTRVARTLVGVLSEAVIDSAHLEGSPSQQLVLQCLTVFVKADPMLFTATQLERLEPYTQNVTQGDGLEVFFSAVTIYRYSLPHQTLIKPGVLETLRLSLLSVIPKLTHMKSGVSEVVACVFTIDELLGSTERVAKWCLSVLKGIARMRSVELVADSQLAQKLSRLMVIAGRVGRAYDFRDQLDLFEVEFKTYKFETIQELVIIVASPFSSPEFPLKVRQEALEAMSEVSQAWPKGFERKDVINAFKMALQERNSILEQSVLAGLEEFFCGHSDLDGKEEDIKLGAGIATGAERLGRTYVAADKDRASSHLSQTFLTTINDIALGSCNAAACIAAKLIISFISQSLVMPKEAPPKLIAFETSPESTIAKLAYAEHKVQHSKHESSWDKEYMRAVQAVFNYQRQAVGDSAGHNGNPPVAKLHLLWDTLKSGKAQIRKKFLGNIAQKLAFDFSTLELAEKTPLHLVFVKFCTENLAFFEYDKVDDLQHLIAELEKTFSASGTAIAQAVENDVLQLRVGSPTEINVAVNGTDTEQPDAKPVQPARLYKLAVSSQICLLIWEARSLLHRLWTMQKHKPRKVAAKDSVKAVTPNRATNAGYLVDAYLKRVEHIMQALSTVEAQRSICGAFVETISVDSEVRVNAGSGDDNSSTMDVDAGYDTPSGDSNAKSPSLTPSGKPRGQKRKSFGGSAGGTPRKKGKRPSMSKRNRSGSVISAAVDEDAVGGWE